MKLPEDKNERTKILVLIALGGLILTLGVIQGIVAPVLRSRSAKMARIVELEELLLAARREIREAQSLSADQAETLQRIHDLSERFMLKPVLGNYLLSASGEMERLSRTAPFDLPSVKQIGVSELPRRTSRRAPVHVKAYRLRLEFSCGFYELIDYVRLLEEDNPYRGIVALAVSGRPEQNPLSHTVSIDLDTVIWTDGAIPASLSMQRSGGGRHTEGPDAEM